MFRLFRIGTAEQTHDAINSDEAHGLILDHPGLPAGVRVQDSNLPS